MNTIILSTENNKDLETILYLAKKLKIKVTNLSPEDIEEIGLLHAMKEGLKTKSVNKSAFITKLEKKINQK